MIAELWLTLMCWPSSWWGARRAGTRAYRMIADSPASSQQREHHQPPPAPALAPGSLLKPRQARPPPAPAPFSSCLAAAAVAPCPSTSAFQIAMPPGPTVAASAGDTAVQPPLPPPVPVAGRPAPAEAQSEVFRTEHITKNSREGAPCNSLQDNNRSRARGASSTVSSHMPGRSPPSTPAAAEHLLQSLSLDLPLQLEYDDGLPAAAEVPAETRRGQAAHLPVPQAAIPRLPSKLVAFRNQVGV